MVLQYEGLYCIVQFFFSCRSHGARSGVTLNYPMTFAGRDQSPKMKYKSSYEKLIILCDLSQIYNMKIRFVFFIIVDFFLCRSHVASAGVTLDCSMTFAACRLPHDVGWILVSM